MFSEVISPESRMQSTDRIFKFEHIDKDKAAKDTTGMTDPRLFRGDNKLHCIMDPQTALWYFKLDNGSVPQPLTGRYTGFRQAETHASHYYANRNIKITALN